MSFSNERVNVIHICAHHFLDNCSFIEDVIAMHDTYIFIRKMDDVSSFQLPVICHEGDMILQDKVICVCRVVGLDGTIPNDLVGG